MRRALSVACFGIALSSASVANGFGTDEPIPAMTASIVLLASPSSPNDWGGKIIAGTISELRKRSATFDEMLSTLAVSRVQAFMSPSVDASQLQGLIGRTRFVVGGSGVVAFVQVATWRHDRQRVRAAVAHELAHVVEVTCLGMITNQETLYQRLRLQVPKFSWTRREEAMETRFAIRAGEAVLREAQRKDRGVSQLAQLTEREGLMACPGIQPAPHLVIAQHFDEERPVR
jgi:hypothetical protein